MCGEAHDVEISSFLQGSGGSFSKSDPQPLTDEGLVLGPDPLTMYGNLQLTSFVDSQCTWRLGRRRARRVCMSLIRENREKNCHVGRKWVCRKRLSQLY